MLDVAIPVTHIRTKDMYPRRQWRKIKQIAMQNARLAGISKAEWERRRMAYPRGPRAADFFMLWLPTYNGAYSDMRRAPTPITEGGCLLDGLT